MTEEEYIRYLKKNFHLSKKEIEADIADCQRETKAKGISVEEEFDAEASITIFSPIKVKTYDRNFLKKTGEDSSRGKE